MWRHDPLIWSLVCQGSPTSGTSSEDLPERCSTGIWYQIPEPPGPAHFQVLVSHGRLNLRKSPATRQRKLISAPSVSVILFFQSWPTIYDHRWELERRLLIIWKALLMAQLSFLLTPAALIHSWTRFPDTYNSFTGGKISLPNRVAHYAQSIGFLMDYSKIPIHTDRSTSNK